MAITQIQQLYILLWAILGAIAAIIYSLRRIFLLELRIRSMERNILQALGRRTTSSRRKRRR